MLSTLVSRGLLWKYIDFMLKIHLMDSDIVFKFRRLNLKEIYDIKSTQQNKETFLCSF